LVAEHLGGAAGGASQPKPGPYPYGLSEYRQAMREYTHQTLAKLRGSSGQPPASSRSTPPGPSTGTGSVQYSSVHSGGSSQAKPVADASRGYGQGRWSGRFGRPQASSHPDPSGSDSRRGAPDSVRYKPY